MTEDTINELIENEEEVEEAEIETIQLLVFQLGESWYGINIKDIKEIIKVDKITWVPGAVSYVVGVINHRGMIVPIIDIRELLGLGKSDIKDESKIIIGEAKEVSTGIGILVDEISDMVVVPVNEISAVPLTMDKRKSRYITQEVRIEEKLVGIVDIHSVTTAQEIKR